MRKLFKKYKIRFFFLPLTSPGFSQVEAHHQVRGGGGHKKRLIPPPTPSIPLKIGR